MRIGGWDEWIVTRSKAKNKEPKKKNENWTWRECDMGECYNNDQVNMSWAFE